LQTDARRGYKAAPLGLSTGGGAPDPNIDFRRVPNLVVLFKKKAAVLTTDLEPGNVENLKEWQGGDIVVFAAPHEHIGIVSDHQYHFRFPQAR